MGLSSFFKKLFPEREPVFHVLFESMQHAAAELSGGRLLRLKAGGKDLVAAMWQNKLYVMENRCPHEGKKLHAGTCREGSIVCPYHRHRIELLGGWNLTQPGTGRAIVFLVTTDAQGRPGIFL
jgi:nitrite reductase/ring-hydroxylating ferredoxin subunit